MPKIYYRTFWLGFLIILIFIIDRMSKWLAMRFLPQEGVFIIPRLTGIILERNQGIAYSLPLPAPWLLVAVSLIIIILTAFLIKYLRKKDFVAAAALSLIITGAVSNLLDRLRYGYVVDMLVLTSWPVFNIADVMILAGAVWLVIDIWQRRRRKPN